MDMVLKKTQMSSDVWEKIVLALMGALIGGAPGYFIIGPSKPSRMEVMKMIENNTPVVVEEIIKDVRANNYDIDKRLAVIQERLSITLKKLEE